MIGQPAQSPDIAPPPDLADQPALAWLDRATLAALRGDLGWLALQGGQILFKAGEAADSLYLLISGTLGVIASTDGGGAQLVAELHAGETVGEMSLISGEVHSATIIALRHAELYRMPKPVFERLVAAEPRFLAWITKLLVHRLQRTTRRLRVGATHRTVAMVPLDETVVLDDLMARLLASLRGAGRRACRFEPAMGERPVEWFDAMEAEHDLVLYQSKPLGPDRDPWSRFCLRQADRIILIARCGAALPDPLPVPDANPAGRKLRVDLVILTPPGAADSGRSIDRPERFGAIYHVRAEVPGDAARLARHLAGRAVGLVLAGGAARGFAHIGAIRALREAGVPIDRVGGTSMGAIIAAGIAAGWDDRELPERIHRGFVVTNPLNDYTFPWVALFRGARVDALLREHYGEVAIEALSIPFFCVSTNLTRGGVQVHSSGTLWRALRASVAIPGVLPPVLEQNEVLVDGGVIDNFPVDIMAASGPGPIIGVDVSGSNALTPGSEARSQTRGFINWLRPEPGPLPGIVSVLSRVGTVSSKQQAAAARAQLDLLIEPDLAGIPLLDWRSFDRAVESGYHAARLALERSDQTLLAETKQDQV